MVWITKQEWLPGLPQAEPAQSPQHTLTENNWKADQHTIQDVEIASAADPGVATKKSTTPASRRVANSL